MSDPASYSVWEIVFDCVAILFIYAMACFGGSSSNSDYIFFEDSNSDVDMDGSDLDVERFLHELTTDPNEALDTLSPEMMNGTDSSEQSVNGATSANGASNSNSTAEKECPAIPDTPSTSGEIKKKSWPPINGTTKQFLVSDFEIPIDVNLSTIEFASLDGVTKESYESHVVFLEKHSDKISADLDKTIGEHREALLMCACLVDERDALKKEIKELKRPKLKRNNSI